MESDHYILTLYFKPQVQSLFNMFLSQTKEMFKKMNHVHPIGKNQGLLEDLGAEVSKATHQLYRGSCSVSCG